jgi:hypothetical protein
VDVFCLDDENVLNDRIYVHYVIQDGESVLGHLMAFKINDPSSTVVADNSFGNDPLEYIVSPNGSVFIGKRNIASCGCYVYFYNWDLTSKGEPFFCQSGCIKEFDYIFEKNYFVFTSMCDSKIYFFQDGEHEINLLGYCGISYPHSFAYNSDEEIGYCSNGAHNFHTVDVETFTANPFPTYPGLTLVEELFYNPNDDLVYGISEQKVYIIGSGSILGSYDLDASFDITGLLNRDDDYILNEIENKLYLPVTNESGYFNSKKILALDLSNGENTILSCDLSYQKSVLVLFPTDKYSLFGKTLSFYPDKQNIFCAQMYFSNASLLTTHTETRSFRGDWNWMSFPCMPRLGNAGYSSKSLLEDIIPLPGYLKLITQDAGIDKWLTYQNQNWNTNGIPFLFSTKGYKYYSTPIMTQNLQVTGVVLDPSTPIPLNSAYENWIGYFIEYPLMPQAAFAGVWDKLTRITTRNWTMFKINGQWFSSTRITPLNYGEGLIVAVSENCELIWNHVSAPAEEYAYPPTEFYSYEEKAEYTPFYFELDGITGISEIGLTVNDSCVGAAAVEPGDSIVEVNAYLTGTQSGETIEVETWSGFKSVKMSPDKYSVVDPVTRKRMSRKVYTGEHKAYYILSFKSGETSEESPVALLQPASPNPFNSATQLSFVLNRQANVSLTVYDLQGNTIKTLLRGNYPEGLYDAGWTGTDTSEKQVENGVYIIRLTVDDKMIKNEKVVLIK